MAVQSLGFNMGCELWHMIVFMIRSLFENIFFDTLSRLKFLKKIADVPEIWLILFCYFLHIQMQDHVMSAMNSGDRGLW